MDSLAQPLPPDASGAVPAPPPEGRAWLESIRPSLPLLAFSAFLIACLWLALAAQVHRERIEAIRNAEVNLANLTRAFAEHTARTIEGADQAIRFVRSEFVEHGRDMDVAAYLHNKTIIDSTFHLISLIDASGLVANSSQPFQRLDLSDREHFKVHVGASEDRLFISKPVLGRVSKKWSIQLTRRMTSPDGVFDGVVVLSLSPDYLTSFYADVDLGRHGVISLVGNDGIVRARATRDDSQAAQDLSGSALLRDAMDRRSGATTARSRIDGVERVYSFRSLDQYGLMVFSGIGLDDVMAEPNERRGAYVIGAALVTLAILGFVAGLVRRAGQQRRLVLALEASNAQALQASRMKTNFLASVSHELRTPLNGILGYAELLKDCKTDTETADFGDVIHQSARHLLTLVNTILDLAKIESGRMTMRRERVDLTKLLAGVRTRSAIHAQERGLVLGLCLHETCPAVVETDPTRLTQVLDNLVNNALKFTDTGRVDIEAHGEVGGLVVEVRDTGAGIPERLLDSIFSRFHAVTTDFVHPAQGAGLGLPLAYELMQLLGGSLSVRSSPQGTFATVRLPAAAPIPEEPPR